MNIHYITQSYHEIVHKHKQGHNKHTHALSQRHLLPKSWQLINPEDNCSLSNPKLKCSSDCNCAPKLFWKAIVNVPPYSQWCKNHGTRWLQHEQWHLHGNLKNVSFYFTSPYKLCITELHNGSIGKQINGKPNWGKILKNKKH